ncbi:MAG: hypothetical protein V4487_04810 [Chlamydiota bacterium]
MRIYSVLAILFLGACASGGSLMTTNSFYDIPIGASTTEVTQTVGAPYAIHKKEDGSVEYEYIERQKAGARNIQERHYYLLLKEGKVVSKRMQQSSPLPYFLESFDSYDMQTTQNRDAPVE